LFFYISNVLDIYIPFFSLLTKFSQIQSVGANILAAKVLFLIGSEK